MPMCPCACGICRANAGVPGLFRILCVYRRMTAAPAAPDLRPCGERNPGPPEALAGKSTDLKEIDMLGWALAFLIIALIAGVLGFGGIAGASAGIAQFLFVVFVVLFIVAMIARAVRGRPPL